MSITFDLETFRKVRLNWTQIELARFLGCGQTAVSRMEKAGRIREPYRRLLAEFSNKTPEGYTTICTTDGIWIASDPVTGVSVSGRTLAEALAELRRLLATSEAA
ncbi:MAG TPA: helix-turn-helix domain-containing protein [Tianweitania sediminis]|jgi:transcriptional regulator with XRE-family HTH domain|nr:helix-turn-helix domain-containing protein [Tianweitania sediminis]